MTLLFTHNALWEHQAVANTAPGDPTAVTVPTTDWLGPDPAPFGTLGSYVTERPIETAWAVNTGLWLRRNVTVDGLRPLVLRGRIENAVLVYFNGDYIGAVNPTNASITSVRDFTLVIPRSVATAGTHEIALLCLDEAGGTTGDTTYIYLEADYLRGFFPYPPEKVRERLEWKTDVIEAEDSTEDRLALRERPRQSFNFDYPTSNTEYARAFNLVIGSMPEQWLIPVWTEAQRLGAVSAGAFSITAVTDRYDFRDESLVLLWETPRKWQILGTTAISSGSIGVTQPTEAFTNAWLLPIRKGYIVGNVNRQTNSHVAVWSIGFEVEDNVVLASDAPDQFLADDIYFLEGLLSGSSITDNVIQKVEVTDFDLGAVAYFSPWTNARVSRPYRVVLADAEEVWQYRLWLHRRAGRYRQFWSPSLDADLRLRSAGTITDSLIIDSDDYLGYASNRTHLAVQTKDGTWYARTITDATELDSERTQLNLDSAINVAASDVLRVSYLGLKRLETDKIDFNWLGGGACQIEVRLLEIAL
ncbi:MAG: hypothetical protein RBT55_03675 [Rhodocyclaceae bacterium]|jgi:hypothetical protein|nr:hypothetical protein [Rhodocyclaceae bacterium]